MNMPPEQPIKNPKNKQAQNSLVLGIVSIILALFNFAPGLYSALGCAGVAGSLFAIISGIQGIRAAKQLDGNQRNYAIIGMIAAGISLLIFVIVMGLAALRGVTFSQNLRSQ